MNSQRVNLSSPGISGRIKKYDRYVHRPGVTVRKTQKPDISGMSQKRLKNEPNGNFKSLSSPYINKLDNTKNNEPNNQTGNSTKNSSKAEYIALHSVRNAHSSKQPENQLAQQFSDEREVVYTPAKSKVSRLQRAMYAFGVLVLIFSATASIQTLFTNKQAQEQIATLGVRTDEQGVSEGTGSEPSEGPVSDQAIAAYQVSNPEDPRYLRIPELEVFARIKSLGVDNKGAVDAPWNINDAGWYNGSSRPGNSIGSSLILGHVSGWSNPGVFKNLDRLENGSKFEIEKGNGKVVSYEVVRSENIPLDQVNMANILSSEESGIHDLKLMTCAGKYNRDTETYDDRLVVYAKQLK